VTGTATTRRPAVLGAPGAEGASATVAMVGAGQLARMTQQAAIALGVRLRVLAAGPGEPAVAAGAQCVLGDPADLECLRELAQGAEVLTLDHERVPPEHLHALERDGVALEPCAAAALFGQDKLHARRELSRRGFPVPEFAHARSREEVASFAAAHGWPLIAKAPRGGYDGRGVWTLAGPADAHELLTALPDGLLVEPELRIECELAVLLARSRSGECVCYEPVQTLQRDAMCREIIAPARVDARVAADARELATALAAEIDATGVLAVELFLTDSGLRVNELALRPHNSGHYTIEGCATSQFEQHLRAVLGWPLGAPTLLAPAVVTVNVLGAAAQPAVSSRADPRSCLRRALGVPGAHVHLYGKEPRPGRKLGHVTVCAGELQGALHAARLAAALLEGRES